MARNFTSSFTDVFLTRVYLFQSRKFIQIHKTDFSSQCCNISVTKRGETCPSARATRTIRSPFLWRKINFYFICHMFVLSSMAVFDSIRFVGMSDTVWAIEKHFVFVTQLTRPYRKTGYLQKRLSIFKADRLGPYYDFYFSTQKMLFPNVLFKSYFLSHSMFQIILHTF